MNRFKGSSLMVAGLALAFMQGVAQAQSSVTYSGDGRPSRIFRPVQGLTGQDAQFLHDAAIDNMFEVEVSKVAEQRGSSDFTKEFAKEMDMEHSGSLEELKAVSAKKGVECPSQLPPELQHTINYLSQLSGSDFDEAYRRVQLKAHAGASTQFKAEISNGRDEEVKGYAVLTLPAIESHYKLAEARRTMMGPTKADHGI